VYLGQAVNSCSTAPWNRAPRNHQHDEILRLETYTDLGADHSHRKK
jgi:hypothetical protein